MMSFSYEIGYPNPPQVVAIEVAQSFVDDLDVAFGGAAYIAFARKINAIDDKGAYTEDLYKKRHAEYKSNLNKVLGNTPRVLSVKPNTDKATILNVNPKQVLQDDADNVNGTGREITAKFTYTLKSEQLTGWSTGTSKTKGWKISATHKASVSIPLPIGKAGIDLSLTADFSMSDTQNTAQNGANVQGQIIQRAIDVPVPYGTGVDVTVTLHEVEMDIPFEATIDVGGRQMVQTGVWRGVAVSRCQTVVEKRAPRHASSAATSSSVSSSSTPKTSFLTPPALSS